MAYAASDGEGSRTSLRYDGEPIAPPLRVRLYNAPSTPVAAFSEFEWDGTRDFNLETPFKELAALSAL